MVKILFYTPVSLVEKFICWYSHGPYCHVAIQHEVEGITMLTQAHASRGVFCSRLTQGALKPALTIELPWVDERTAWMWLAGELGLNYGFFDILTFSLSLRVYDEKKHGYTGLICSELAANFLRAMGDVPGVLVPPEWVHPLATIDSNTLAQMAHISPSQLAAMMPTKA